VTVECLVSGGTATAGSDYELPDPNPVLLSFGPGQRIQRVRIPIVNDGDAEGAETIGVTLQNPSGGATRGSLSTGSVGINDNDAPAFRFARVAARIVEGDRRARVVVQRLGSVGDAATVNYAATSGTATAGDDFTAASGTLTFPRGARVRTFFVPILGDAVDEGPETIVLTLSGPSAGHELGYPTAATVTIVDNDVAGRIEFAAPVVSASEGAGQATVTVRRTRGIADAASVAYTAADGSATAGSDYAAVSGTLTFGPRETTKTVSVTLIDDSEVEPPEALTLILSDPAGGAELGNLSSATLWVVDDDS